MTITMDRAKVLATRYAEVRKARGRSLERSAAEMGISLRTCQRLAGLAAGTDPNYSPDTGTLETLEAWLNTAPPPDVNADYIDHIVAIVRAANLGVAAGEAVVAAFRAVWGVALAHRPWYGDDDDARALLLELGKCSPTGQRAVAARIGMEVDSARFVRARSVLVALGLLHPADGLLVLTQEGKARAACEGR